MIVYEANGIEVHLCSNGFLRVRAWQRYIHVTPEELADIAEAVAQHLSAAECADETPYIHPALGGWYPGRDE